jgi:hypothetical protein
MQQIADWLEKLGMSEYAQRFADNDIDFPILGDLTDQHLKDLGVASLGHRLKILRAIAELDRQEATVAPPAMARVPRSGPAPPSPPPTPGKRSAGWPRDRSDAASTGIGGVHQSRIQIVCAVLPRFTCRD